jgi:hypothetical protein
MTEENSDLAAERDRLAAEVARLQVSRDTGVPPFMLGNAATEDAARAAAERALAWKAATQPAQAAPTAAVPAYSVSQISRETLQYLSPDQINAAHRQGRLEAIGAPAPPKHNGRP